jgi:outer membrane protein TolC
MAKTQLDTARVQETDIGVMRAEYEHAIAILIGKPPAEFTLEGTALTLPPCHAGRSSVRAPGAAA